MTVELDSNNEIEQNDAFVVVDLETNQEQLVRGETPEGIERKCLELCADFIGQHWSNLTLNDVRVQRITGGLCNQFYRVNILNCQLEPNDVGVKIYQEKLLQEKCTDGRANDIIVLKATSDLGIGPKVYGLTNNIAIFDFIDCEYFGIEHHKNDQLVRKLLKNLAIFHHMDLPVIKSETFPDKYMEEAFNKAYDKLHMKEIAREMKLKHLGSMCLKHEHAVIADFLRNKLHTPKVFCHNDFRTQNILVSKKDSRIYFCDVEFAAYSYRPNDLVSLLMEWGVGMFRYRIPEDTEIRKVCQIYIDECSKVVPGYSLKPENSLEQILKEVKIQFLRCCLFLISFMLEKEESFPDTVPFDYKKNLLKSETGMEFYVRAKNRFIKQGIIEPF